MQPSTSWGSFLHRSATFISCRHAKVSATNFSAASTSNLRARSTRAAKYSGGSQGNRMASACAGGTRRRKAPWFCAGGGGNGGGSR